jgi:adenylyltransferase/sulfurtransferase
MPAQSPWDISVEDLKKLKDENGDFVLVDVREPHEVEICEIGGTLIPLGQIAERAGELDKNAHVVVYCRSGGRSAKAVQFLRGNGFANAWNVNGGILAWIERVDPSLTPY